MWQNTMFQMSASWWELVLRSGIVYAFLLILIRITGKRQIGQLSPFDLVLLLVLSNAVQNSMNAGDNSLIGGLISATTLVILNYLIGIATYRNKTIENLVEGKPEVLIHNGKIIKKVMGNTQLTMHELNAAIREAGCASVEDVRCAILENNGTISVISRKG